MQLYVLLQLGGIHTNTVTNYANGTMSIEEMRHNIRNKYDDHMPLTKVMLNFLYFLILCTNIFVVKNLRIFIG